MMKFTSRFFKEFLRQLQGRPFESRINDTGENQH